MERGGLRGGCEPSDNMELNLPPPPIIVPPEEDIEEPEEQPVVQPVLQQEFEGMIVQQPPLAQFMPFLGGLPLEEDVPLGVLLQQPEPEIDLDDKPFWCPFYFCQAVHCMWDGYTTEDLYDHFDNNPGDHNVGVVQAKEVNEPRCCEWTNFKTTCDLGGEASASYCLLMKKDPELLFFLSAKCSGTTDSNTDIQVFYIGEEEPADEYYCNLHIHDRGQDGTNPILLSLTCHFSNTKSDIVTIRQSISETKANTVLKSCCAENGSLYFCVEVDADVSTETPTVSDLFGDIDDIEDEYEVD